MKNVAVLTGGWPVERPVSLNSGRGRANAPEAGGYRVRRIDVGRDIDARLRRDVACNAPHRRFGEDSTIQGLPGLLGLPYGHSGLLAYALAAQKDRAEVVLKSVGAPLAGGRALDRFKAARRHVCKPPDVLKPLNAGPLCGPVIAKADRALGNIEIEPMSEAPHGYDAKYAKRGLTHKLPAKLKPKIYHEVQNLALRAHRALGCRGLSRADFRWDDSQGDDDDLVRLEVNQPGMTETPLAPEAAAEAGLSFGELLEWMVEDALCDR